MNVARSFKAMVGSLVIASFLSGLSLGLMFADSWVGIPVLAAAALAWVLSRVYSYVYLKEMGIDE